MEQAKVLPFPTPNHNNYNNNAHARVIEELDRSFAEVFGYPMKPYHRKICLQFMAEGMNDVLIMAALNITAGAPVPAWRYTEAILNRWMAAGVKTLEQWTIYETKFQERRRELANHHKSW